MCSKGNPVIIKCFSKTRKEEHLTGARTLARMTCVWMPAKTNAAESQLAEPESWGWMEKKEEKTTNHQSSTGGQKKNTQQKLKLMIRLSDVPYTAEYRIFLRQDKFLK